MQACFSADGDLIWYKKYWDYGLWGREAHLRPDGNCWFTTNDHMLLTSTIQGNVIEAYPIQYPGDYPSNLYSGDGTIDGGMIVSGACDYYMYPGQAAGQPETWDGWIVKLSNTGEIEWQSHLEDYNSNQCLYGVRQLNSGGYIACGSHIGGWLIRFEPEQGIQEPDEADEMEIEALPNPSQSQVSINAFVPQSGYTTIEIFDIAGRLLDFWAGPLAPGHHNISFNGLPSGIFLVARLKEVTEECVCTLTVLP